MTKKRVIVQKLLADAPKGRRQKAKFIMPTAAISPDKPREIAIENVDRWPVTTVDALVRICDTLMTAALVGGTLAFLIWRAKHGG